MCQLQVGRATNASPIWRTRAFLDYLIEHTRKTVADPGVDAPPPVPS